MRIQFQILFLGCLLCGCDSGGGKANDTVTSSTSEVDLVSCGDISCSVPAAELEEILESAEEAGDSVLEIADAADDITNNGGLDQVVRIAKYSGGYLKAFVCGCGNTVVEEDNDSVVVSDDDVNTAVGAAAEES